MVGQLCLQRTGNGHSEEDGMESLHDTLLKLEHESWGALKTVDGAKRFYAQTLSEDSLMSVPYGIATREEVLASLDESPVAVGYEIRNARTVQLGESSGLLVYEMTQRRRGMEPFEAAICTGWSRRDGRWLMVYHQQTPLATHSR